MFSNYLKIAYRNLLKYRAYSILTVAGLAVGIAATILIILYIRFETSYDDFHINGKNIYRVSFASMKEGSLEGNSPEFTAPFAPAAKEEIPEVQNYVRISTPRVAYALMDGQSIKLDNVRHADSAFFEIFSFGLERGNVRNALAQPYSIVLSHTTAQILFGTQDPIGRTIRLDGKDDYLVTGVAQDPPGNSHIQFNALVSFSTLFRDPRLFLGWDGGNQYVTYLLLTPNANPAVVQKECVNLMWKHINQQLAAIGIRIDPSLQPLSGIHVWYDSGSESLRTNLTVFAVIALFILVIACMNFINLSTARAIRRAKEVGVRKALGAARINLVGQFLGEAILVSVLGCLLAVGMVEVVMPWFREFLGLPIPSLDFLNFSGAGSFLALILLVGVLAGGYPALYFSSFGVVRTLKAGTRTGSTKSMLRNILVTLQFAVSIGLVVCTLFVNGQLRFMMNKELGFRKEGMIVIPLRGEEAQSNVEVVQQELSGIQGVAEVTASSEVPSAGFTSNGYFPEGRKSPVMIHVVDVDDQFLSTYGISLVSGTAFSRDRQSTATGYLINESLASLLGWKDPVGKHITRGGVHEVIGVVKDFHFASLREAIEPLIITRQPWQGRFDNLTVRLQSADIPRVLGAIRETWNKVVPASPFEYSFLDSRLEELYGSERKFQDLFLSFSGLAIVLAIGGLLGLAAFAAEQRTKEIGVRKVMGASVVSVVGLLSRDFAQLIILANLIAWPLAWYFMGRWLQEYAYRIDLRWEPFVISGAGVLVCALGAVSFQALKAASANPVEALRYE